MDFKIEKNLLQKGLLLAANIADRKNTLPILANVLIRTEGRDKIVCAATDLHVTLVAELPAKVDKEGGLTVAAKQFGDIVKGLATDEVHISRNDQNWAEIRNGRSEFKVVGMIDRDYPKLPPADEVETLDVDPIVVCDLIDKALPSVSTDEMRQHLSGALLESNGKQLRMVSTDGARLVKVERTVESAPVFARGILIPRKGLLEIRRLLDGRRKPCKLGVGGGYLVIRADELTLTVKLSDSQFPLYEQVIPKSQEHKVFVARDAFLDALRRVVIMASDKNWGVRMRLESGWIKLEAQSPEIGNAIERIDVEYKGPSVAIGFNARYFLDFLSQLDAPEVQMEVAGELDPILLRSSDGDDYLGVVMPMRL